ncbi:calcium-binding protein [Methylosinus trichosporium]|uniref:Calcium-binding protein n=1 Tax=Methylosinus trichosporium (strain ATCC 35070 / NCIMB 11131 / UNIQEM 75 / OB3b) TaxID=595536 RepID=A0A2D2D6G1_METT3|nr:calcium-binding protein [Methylosinus trichosporium]ATQ70597.1 hypothetical protein CQW49_21610 [Methylosinus trichosporium OB3b]OBS50780.1 hypothetical protein A8B73_19805 [Methylosinus sp. 3S-1]
MRRNRASTPQQWIFTDEYAGGKTITPVTPSDRFNAAAATGNNVVDLRAGTTDSSINGKTVTVSGDLAKGFGGDGNDTLIGNGAGNLLKGGRGNDLLIGGAGADTLDGGAGVDTADYGDKTSAVAVTLNGAINATVTVGGVAEDTIRNIENVTGGAASDTLTGDDAANLLSGGNGNDLLKGAGGADILDGGAGSDTVDYRDKTAAVAVTLNGATNASVKVGGVAEDTIRNIENIYGGSGADTLIGDGSSNLLRGGAGADVLDGGAGVDTADYRDKTASVAVTLNGATNASVKVGGVAEDTIRNIENIYGGSGADTLIGDGSSNLLRGGAGADVLDGGAGVDTADYSDKTSSVAVTLNGATNATVMVGGVVEDTVRNIENVTGGAGADTLVGDSSANLLSGGGGDDVLTGAGGADRLTGGSGSDTFVFAPAFGQDIITDFSSTDRLRIDDTIFANWSALSSHAQQVGTDTVITASVGNTITLQNVTISSLTASQMEFV